MPYSRECCWLGREDALVRYSFDLGGGLCFLGMCSYEKIAVIVPSQCLEAASLSMISKNMQYRMISPPWPFGCRPTFRLFGFA